MRYSRRYSCVFEGDPEAMAIIQRSETEPSLGELVEAWLERTPGLEEDNFSFWGKYEEAVNRMLNDQMAAAEKTTNQMEKDK